jgi:carbamoyltransferase
VNILGISAFYHDSAAALVRDGEIIAAAQEERFSRRKGDPDFPDHAIAFCLRAARITPADLDHVVFYEKPLTKFERLLETYLAYAPAGFESFRAALPQWTRRKLRIPSLIRGALGDECRAQLSFTTHHESHAASSYFPSPFDHAAVLTLDACGEWGTGSLGVGHGNRLETLREMRFPHSLGMLYSAFTYYTGFKVNSGEYKLMGLAPYGQPKYRDRILDHLVDLRDDGSLWLDMAYFNYCQGLTMTSENFHELFDGPPRKPESWIRQKDMDLAASIQAVCEEAMLRAARYLHALTGLRTLVMAGGVALNCVANGRLLRESPFERIWVQPAAGDAGGALGAALLVWHHLLSGPRARRGPDGQKGSFLGPEYTDEEVRIVLDSVGARCEHILDEAALLDRVVALLLDDKVVGWFQGRMEYGPRALGARSILADPRNPRMQQTLNLKVKYRESFRPFAPSILREYLGEIVEMGNGEDSPYMLLVSHVRPELRLRLGPDALQAGQNEDLRVRVAVPRSTIPAVTHVDYSARVQSVDAERHGRFYRLLRRFHTATGCPVLVNTSFNIRGEPIVCTPDDAYRCFMATELDALAIENHLLLKCAQAPGALADVVAYKARFPAD